MDSVIEWFLERPHRIVDSGRYLFCTGFLLLMAGLWGYVATTSVDAVFSLAHSANPQTNKALADIYPSLPTWWIPESLFGFAISLLLIVVGLVIALVGKKYKRFLVG